MTVFNRLTRFSFVSFLLLCFLTIGFGWMAETTRAQLPGGTLDPISVPKYVEPLIIPPVMAPVGEANGFTEYQIAVRQFSQQVLPQGFPQTTVWGYGNPNFPGTVAEGGSFNFPGFTIETRRNNPVRVTWINDLTTPDEDCLPHLLPVDQTLHWANPPGGLNGRDTRGTDPLPYTGPVPMVTHVHGARVPGTSDGYPEAWWLPSCNYSSEYAQYGSTYATEQSAMTDPGTAVFEYPNDQRATTLWYHDHALGITRLNVYAGMAGFWLLRDDQEDALNLPGPAPQLGDAPETDYYEIPIVIQDRSFNADGSLFYPGTREFFDEYPGPYFPETDIPPSWNPEFFGNMMVVNGRTWPYLEVKPRLYRLRLLNGTNSRFLILKMSQPSTFYQIGTEGGLLPGAPVPLTTLLIAPAERADVLVDFSNFAPGTTITLMNLGPDEPYRGGSPGVHFDPADPDTTGEVMQFRVVESKEKTPASQRRIPRSLPAIETLPAAVESRDITLNEEVSEFEDIPIAAFLGTAEDGPLGWSDPITENPTLGSTEVWNIINLTEDAHPIHLHLVMFQVVDRIPIAEESYILAQEGYLAGDPAYPNPPDWTTMQTALSYPPKSWESGWKDTVIAYPGQVTRITARFDLPGLYVWHCHILEHEDNEMMRPYEVLLNDAMTVNIDIYPEDATNPFDCNAENGVIPVAILGSDTFDIATVDHATARFEGAWELHLDNLSRRRRHEMDVNEDGFMDLVLHFQLDDTTLRCDATEGRLTAYTYDGNVIFGVDILSQPEPVIAMPSCSATYWAQNIARWESLYSTNTSVSTVFNTLLPLVDLNGDSLPDTLLDALNYTNASPLHMALREATAAILNFDHPDVTYPFPWFIIIDMVNNAMGDEVALEAVAMELGQYNNDLCLAPT